MVTGEVILSPEGLQKLEDELEHLKSVKRRDIAHKIKQAREFGGIEENPEYENAKNEQAFIEGRILTLEKTLRNARLMDESDIDPDKVSIGSIVKLKNLDQDSEVEYMIVGATEADPLKRKISHLSPVAQAIIGQKAGNIIEISVPVGVVKYQILEISR